MPLIRQPFVPLFENKMVDGAGKAPHATVVFASAVIVGNAAGLT